MITFRSPAKFDKEAALLVMTQEQIDKKSFAFKGSQLQKDILSLLKAGKFSADNGEVFPIISENKLVLLLGVGKQQELSLTTLRTSLKKALQSSFLSKIETVEIVPHEQNEKSIGAVIEAVLIGTYAWKKYQAKDKGSKVIDQKKIWIATAAKKSYEEVIKICDGVNFTRDLVNDNADKVTSVYIEQTIKEIVKGKKEIALEILNRSELKAKGLNLHLAVNQGSRNEPKLIIAKYNGASAKENFTAIVGKGITFDTGGLNLKPTGSMETMRIDMSGAAAVIGTLKNTVNLKLKKNILFVVALAENVIGSGSYKPGDVIKSYNGKTVEIGNTDAEGRLVLADAIAYIVKNYKPNTIIDIATLTGACVVALGYDYSGLMSNDDGLAEKLLRAANETDDRAWRLPIYPEIKEHVKSLIADIKNIGLPKGAAGACSAAEFLRQFVDNTKWAHLDIAGTAYSDGPGRMYFGYGATGAGVRLLTEYLKQS